MTFAKRLIADSTTIERYYYYIFKGKKAAHFYSKSIPPVVQKINRKNPHHPKKKERNISEGPYDTLMELKENSLIYNEITKPQIRETICKRENIVEIYDCEAIDKDGAPELTFKEAIRNATINKFDTHKSKAVNYYDPERARVLEVITKDNKTGVYLARIEKLNKETEKWVPKEEYYTFFPDEWPIKTLFYECEHAYKNKRHIIGKKFIGETHKGIKVVFIINDDDDNIYTCSPILDND